MRIFQPRSEGFFAGLMTAFLTIAIVFTATQTTAQTFPERTLPGLKDYADIVDPDTEQRIFETITDIFQTEGVDIAIATLSSVQFYAQDATIESYATSLFNAWELGDADDNDGILILVFRDDRDVRIELGQGYDTAASETAQNIIGADILPAFRDANYGAGIEAGVIGLRDKLISPPAVPSGGSSDGEGSNAIYYIGAAIVAAIAGLIGLNRRNAAKLAATPCTACGKTGLTRSRKVITEPTVDTEGSGETRLTCAACGHVDATPYSISKLKPDIPEGGGASKGDGASGKW